MRTLDIEQQDGFSSRQIYVIAVSAAAQLIDFLDFNQLRPRLCGQAMAPHDLGEHCHPAVVGHRRSARQLHLRCPIRPVRAAPSLPGHDHAFRGGNSGSGLHAGGGLGLCRGGPLHRRLRHDRHLCGEHSTVAGVRALAPPRPGQRHRRCVHPGRDTPWLPGGGAGRRPGRLARPLHRGRAPGGAAAACSSAHSGVPDVAGLPQPRRGRASQHGMGAQCAHWASRTRCRRGHRAQAGPPCRTVQVPAKPDRQLGRRPGRADGLLRRDPVGAGPAGPPAGRDARHAPLSC